MNLAIRPLTPARWPDLERVFAAKGCSMARHCWCMYYRVSGRQEPPPPGVTVPERSRAAFRRIVDDGPPPGLIAYRGRTPVGWMALAPREAFARLARSPVMKPVDAQPVWSITCFVVPAEFRGQGVAQALLDGAAAFARRQGATLLEGYPVDKPTRGHDEFMWFGTRAMFERAGFAEVARRRPQRPVMRLTLDAG